MSASGIDSIPKWAEHTLSKTSGAELVLLRDFYNAWLAFHRARKGKLQRKSLEEASQKLLSAAMAVERFRNPNAVSIGMNGMEQDKLND